MKENAMKIKVYSCEFVLRSDLFNGFEHLFDWLSESDPGFTWGCNNRSLVAVEDIVYFMQDNRFDIPETFIDRCNEIGLSTYVDLEN